MGPSKDASSLDNAEADASGSESASSSPASSSPASARPAPENRVLKRILSVPSVKDMSDVLSVADGKDRAVGLLQYVALFASGGRPGPLTSIGLGLNDARRPFRLYKPVESMLPLLRRGGPRGEGAMRALEIVKSCSMTAYVACDHVVWAGQVGALRQDTAMMRWARRVSFGGWATGAAAMAAAKTVDLARELSARYRLDVERRAGLWNVDDPTDADEWARRATGVEERAYRAGLDVASGATQALVALALLGAVPVEKRKLSALGMLMSLVGIYQVWLGSIPAADEETNERSIGEGESAEEGGGEAKKSL